MKLINSLEVCSPSDQDWGKAPFCHSGIVSQPLELKLIFKNMSQKQIHYLSLVECPYNDYIKLI